MRETEGERKRRYFISRKSKGSTKILLKLLNYRGHRMLDIYTTIKYISIYLDCSKQSKINTNKIILFISKLVKYLRKIIKTHVIFVH